MGSARVSRVRRAGRGDADEVTRLMIGFRDHWERDSPNDAAFARNCRRLLDDEHTEFLLATVDGEAPCGIVQLRYRLSLWVDGLDCHLEDLFVEAAARGHGAGRALAETAIERAIERGCGRIELDVNAANPPALALYRALGFSEFSHPPGGENLMMRRYF